MPGNLDTATQVTVDDAGELAWSMGVADRRSENEVAKPRVAPWRRRLLVALLIAATVTTAIAIAASSVPILISSENWARDWRVAELSPNTPVRNDIVVLGLDEKTFDTLPYRSPVDRGFLADTLNYLAKVGVRAVGIDILFDRPTEPDKDLAFFTALRDFPAPVVIVWADPDEEELILTQKQKQYMDTNLGDIGKGYANLLDDKMDGVIRWINVRHAAGKDGYPGFPAAIAKSLGYTLPDSNVALDYASWPEDQSSAFPTFSATSFKFMPKQWFASILKDKIVLIGGVLRDTDRYPTPFVAGHLGNVAGTMPGVVIHGHALAQIIDGRRLNIAGKGTEIAVIVVAALIGAGLAALTIPIWLMLSAGIVILGALVTSLGAAYPLTGLMLSIFAPGLGFLAALMVMSFYQQRRFHEERTFIRGALSRYVAEDVVKQLEREPWRLKLGGERRNLSFLFTDIAGFTGLSEETEPMVLVTALNQYLDGASRVILECGGTIDKYIGDAIVVVFGAFGARDSHARNAVDCALALDRFAQGFATAQREKGLNFGITRIGVNTGNAIIGNFGGDLRFDYTAIGDTVNTAARLEGANKYFGTRLCVAGSTLDASPGVRSRPIGNIILKGKTDAIPVYQPLGDGDDGDLAPFDAYADAYALLDSGDPGAASAFEALLAAASDDPLVRFHCERLRRGETGTRIVLEDK